MTNLLSRETHSIGDRPLWVWQTQSAMKALRNPDADEFELVEIERQIKETLTAQRSTLSDLIKNAMTVALGFGLQGIFANFVSGIILLFERPVRVGDTVTISGITGTVTRIQIRATTLLDWDNKELIVPNREFVTGHLINWTLSNPTLRLICPVGIAYGSDTRLATELLYKVAANETEVLKSPEPVVVFDEFGDNSLNFELRIFVTGLNTFRRLRHKINLAIDDEFRQHNIEIAFPQRDLHVRSLPKELIAALRSGEADLLNDSQTAEDAISRHKG